jgi:hypothetical protein
MFDDDPRRNAIILADLLGDGAVRWVFRALIRDRDDDARQHLATALGPRVAALDLADPVLREALLDALEYRISPPDDEDPGPESSSERTLPISFES